MFIVKVAILTPLSLIAFLVLWLFRATIHIPGAVSIGIVALFIVADIKGYINYFHNLGGSR